MNTLEIIKKQANELFFQEGPSHSLEIRQDGEHKFTVVSTSGTSYFTSPSRQQCLERRSELENYAANKSLGII